MRGVAMGEQGHVPQHIERKKYKTGGGGKNVRMKNVLKMSNVELLPHTLLLINDLVNLYSYIFNVIIRN